MNILRKLSVTLLLSLSLLLPPNFASSGLALTGLEIMEKVNARDDGDKQTSDTEMILIDKNKNKRVRKLRTFKKDFGKDTHTVMFFLEPANVKDTGFLTYDYDKPGKDDDQWLYLPALRKTKRIAGSDKSGSFMGSDFNFSDMSKRDLSDFKFKLMKEVKIKGQKVWQIESLPKDDDVADKTGYSKSIIFVRQDNYVVIRSISWVYKSNRLKYRKVNKLEKIDGVWIVTDAQMTTKEGKTQLHSTILRNNNVKFNQDIKDSFFTTRQLEKGM